MFATLDDLCSPRNYNSLPDVVDADVAIKSVKGQLDKLVDAGSSACASTPFAHGELGAFLLHKHWEISDGEAIVEHAGKHPLGRPALIAAAEKLTGDAAVVPSRFQVDPKRKKLVALEYSSDKAVLHAWRALMEQPTLLGNLCSLIGDSGLSNQIGLAILARAISVPEGEDLVEENWNGKSVTSAQVLPRQDELTAVIPTGWAFVGRPITAAGSCIAYCMTAGSSAHCVHHYNRPQVLEE